MSDFTPDSSLPQLPFALKWLATGFVRHGVVAAGASLLSNHIFNSAAQQTAFDNWATDTVLVVLGLAWSLLNQKAKSSADATVAATNQP